MSREAFEQAFVAVSLLVKGGGALDLLEVSPHAESLDARLRQGNSEERAFRLGRALLPVVELTEARRQR